LSYLIKCAVTKKPYKVFGYKGKQVRDNLHSADLVDAFWEIIQKPGISQVFNVGGTMDSNISILEAIKYLSEVGYNLEYEIEIENRKGDHIWWVTDMSRFKQKYPNWNVKRDSFRIIDETISALKFVD
jgi:CDP-paratose 2-epimerase